MGRRRIALWSSARRLGTLAWLESLNIFRDPAVLSLILVVPVLQIMLCGYALQPLGRHIPIVVARSTPGQALVAVLEQHGDFKVVADGLSKQQALAKLQTQQALLALVLPPPLPPSASAVEPDPITLYVDDSNPLRANPALSTLEAQYWRHLVAQEALLLPPLVVTRLYNPENHSTWIMAPTLSGVIVMISMLMLGALSIVREREQGTWEALLATPIYAFEAVIGKALPYLLLGMLQAVLVISCSALLFHLPQRGNLIAFAVFVLVYTLVHLIIGITISAAAKNQMQAMQGAVLFYLPSMLLSGFLFPYENMPAWAQYLGRLFPLTYYVEVARGVLLRGAEASYSFTRTTPMGVLLVLFLALAGLVFRRRL